MKTSESNKDAPAGCMKRLVLALNFEPPTNYESWKNVNAAAHTQSTTTATGAMGQNRNYAMCVSGGAVQK